MTVSQSSCSMDLPSRARTYSQGGQLESYKDSFRINLKTCDILAYSRESLAENRPKWRQLCHQQIAPFHDNRLDELKRRRQQRKDGGSIAILQDRTAPAISVKSVDATAVPL